MVVKFARNRLAAGLSFRLALMVLAGLVTSTLPASSEEEKKPSPCTEDAMIVFDASGSMSGNQTLGIPNSRARIDEVRSALAQVLPPPPSTVASGSSPTVPGLTTSATSNSISSRRLTPPISS